MGRLSDAERELRRTQPVRPVKETPPWVHALGGMAAMTLSLGGIFIVLMGVSGSTMGATRSAALQWEQRQAEVEAAVAETEQQTEVKQDDKSQE